MVFGILAAAVAVPAVVGTTEAVRQGQRQNAREEHRGRKSELVASLPAGSSASRQRREEFDGAIVVLWRNKLYVRTNSNDSQKYLSSAHPFTGYFLQNPQHKQWRAAGHSPTGEGLVSTISHDPPVLNWIYVDPSSHEVKYGTRAEVEMDEGMAGPWDVTAGIGTDRGTGMLGGGRRLTFEGWEGFVCVEEVSSVKEVQEAHDFESSTHSRASTGEYDEDEADQQEDLWLDSERSNDPSRFKLWALYFDAKDDGLSSDGRIGSAPYRYNMLEIELLRSERRRTRETAVEERVDRLRHRKQVEQKSDAKMKSLRETSIASTDSQLEVKQAD